MRSEFFLSERRLNCEQVRLGANRRNESQCDALECECEKGFECERVLDRHEKLQLVFGYDQVQLIANNRKLSYGFGDRCDPSNRSGIWFAFGSHLLVTRCEGESICEGESGCEGCHDTNGTYGCA